MTYLDLMHQCEYLKTDNIYIYKRTNEETDQITWLLTIQRRAIWDDLEKNSIFEQEDEIVWQFETEIFFCPYCGKKLSEPKYIKCLKDTGTVISDCSEWHTRYL